MTTTLERHSFQTETKQLLDLMIHAIYSNKDIFLRELISNSSDAIDKLKFEALTQTELLPEAYIPSILLVDDKENRQLSIEDNGIGMSQEEVVRLIGTIAKSGTKEFATLLKENKETNQQVSSELIGQFGVGFYSTFMVADKVTLTTRKAGESEATRWESTGDGTYTIETVSKPTVGTTITLQLKQTDTDDGMQDYTDTWVLRNIVKKYSDFVSYPIQMDVSREEIERDEEGKPVEGAEPKTIVERQMLNSMKAIWMQPESAVSTEELNAFYQHISHDWQPPLKTFRMKMEGTLEAQALLFIPSKAPMDMFYRDAKRGVQLYVKRVFIMDDCKELMPDYLRFIKGVVDSEDLSLNISREILQQNRQIMAIRKRLVKKVLSTLENIQMDDKETYLTFWSEFGRVLKEGLYEDYENKESLLKLALFQSLSHTNNLMGLQEYIDQMQPGQDAIYYMTGENRKVMENSPHLEAFKAKNYNVLILTDPVDEVWVQSVSEFQGKSFQSVGKGTAELGSEDEKKAAQEALNAKKEQYTNLLEALQHELDSYVKEVRLSNRLTQSVSCLVGNSGDMTPQMEQLLKAMNQEVPASKRILELNPDHPLVQKLQEKYSQADQDASLKDYADLIYGQALLAEGSPLPEPARFSQLVAEAMVKTI